MKRLQTQVMPIKVIQNTSNKGRDQWCQILDQSGKVLHTGQPSYIKRVAKVRYAHLIK